MHTHMSIPVIIGMSTQLHPEVAAATAANGMRTTSAGLKVVSMLPCLCPL